MALAAKVAPAFAAQPDSGKASPSANVQSWMGGCDWDWDWDDWHCGRFNVHSQCDWDWDWDDWHCGRFTAHVDVMAANVRFCPSTSCDIAFNVFFGTRVHVFFSRGGWSNIGPNRWIASDLLNF
jgi:hypothetical protein